MRILTTFTGLTTALLIAISGQAFAASCSDVLVDELSAFSDKGKVAAAAASFGNATMTEVRVRAIASRRGAKNVKEFEQAFRATCPEWLQSNGKLKSNLLLFLYVDNRSSPQWVGLYYGDGLSRLDAHYQRIVGDRFVPRIESFRGGDKAALTPGVVLMFDDLKAVMTQQVSNGGNTTHNNTTIVHAQPTDLSWLKWLAIGVVVIGGGLVTAVLWSRFSQDRGEVQSAQAQVRRVRQGCLHRVIAVSDSEKIGEMEAMIEATKARLSPSAVAELDRLFADFKKQGMAASAAFERFDGVGKDDPNVNGLSADTYRTNEQAYEDLIASSVEPAEETSRKISALLNTASSSAVA
jgi:hypothetical protein